MTATIEGRTHQIPDMWMAGATRSGLTIQEAVQTWHDQTVMQEECQARDTRSEGEKNWHDHMNRWGSDGYPIQKAGRHGWIWMEMFGVKGPPVVYKTKRAAFEAIELYLDVLCDKAAGRWG